MGGDVEAHESSDGVLLVLDATSINITFVEQTIQQEENPTNQS